MADTYDNFADLAANEREGEDFCIVAREGRSGLVILAPHGGKIEPHTSSIATAIAADDHALYLFEGRKAHGNGCLHVTSEHFDEPRCLALVSRSKLALGLHGAKGANDIVILGGRNARAKALVLAALGRFGATDIGQAHLLGRSPDNICNRARESGVQLEISLGLRNKLAGVDPGLHPQRSIALKREFVECIRNALFEFVNTS